MVDGISYSRNLAKLSAILKKDSARFSPAFGENDENIFRRGISVISKFDEVTPEVLQLKIIDSDEQMYS
jgi:hypothetical protein